MGSRRCSRETTCTRRDDGRIVPWLSATEPLSYTPEIPPERNRFFQYTWILPGIFAPHTNLREHYYFGARYKGQSRELFRFWEEPFSPAITKSGCWIPVSSRSTRR